MMTKPRKNKPGGQPKAPEHLAHNRITIRLTDADYEKVDNWSKAFRVSKSEVLRRALSRAKLKLPLPIEHQKLASELGRLGFQMGQLGRRLNTLHHRLDVAKKHGQMHDVEMEEVSQIASECQAAFDEALPDLKIIRDILIDRWEGREKS